MEDTKLNTTSDNMNREIFFILLALLLTPAVSASIGWNGEYWLIGGSSKGMLVKYDGESFVDLSADAGFKTAVRNIASNGTHWLIFADDVLKLFDGNNFTEIKYAENGYITAIAWNGKYWLMSVGDALTIPADKGYSRRVIYRLVKYNGTDFELISANHSVSKMQWGENQWLLAGMQWFTGERKLLVYDEKEFTDLTRAANLSNPVIDEIAWNEDYWLISGYDSITVPNVPEDFQKPFLLRYDGKQFANLGKIQATFASWNGKYWLLGGHELIKYDGENFTKVAVPELFGGKWAFYNGTWRYKDHQLFFYSAKWNKDYWLVFGRVVAADGLAEDKLLKFDGAAFTDLTPELRKTLGEEFILPTQTPEPIVVKPTKPDERFPANYRNIGVALIAFLVVTSYLLWKKRKSW